jgi:hypothetical protein
VGCVFDLDSVLADSDVVMMLRVQRERMAGGFFPSAREYSRRYGLDARRMAMLGDSAIVMHPGPMNRGMEIAAEVADDPKRSTIVEQVTNGVSVRMAVLYLLLGGSEQLGVTHRWPDNWTGLIVLAREHRPLRSCCARDRCPLVTGLVLRNVRPYGEAQLDVRVENGVITELGSAPPTAADDVVDGQGAVLLPGLVDLHTHLREPGREDAETVQTGSAAAALGGYTAVFAMASTEPCADTAGVVEQVWRLGRQTGLVDVQPIGAVTVGRAGTQLAELGAMADSPARVRVFSDDGFCVSDSALMRRALEYVRAFDGIIAQHAEDPRLTVGAQMNEGVVSGRLGLAGWPAAAEEAIVARDALLAGHVGSRLHVCHVSTAGSVELLRWAKGKGWAVSAEVTPHHLSLTDDLAES